MSLVSLSHLCSHIQNASRARLTTTSAPYTTLHLALLLHLQASGFVSSVTLGTRTTPHDPAPITQSNISTRRLWLGLKYHPSSNEPVISKMSMVSKPTKRIWMGSEGLGRVVRGRDEGFVKGMRSPGECLFVSTDRGVLEAREAARRRVGGMVLCRIV
jgi:ribosomal protein S8